MHYGNRQSDATLFSWLVMAGSIRIPASYCGVLGFRPSHGRVYLEHCTPLAHSFDTCGWFARDARTLQSVGRVLLGAGPEGTSQRRAITWRHMLMGADAFALADATCTAALKEVGTQDPKYPEYTLSQRALTACGCMPP